MHENKNIPPGRLAQAIRAGSRVDGRSLLEPMQQEFTPQVLSSVLGKQERVIRYHCQILFGHRSRYRLSREEAGRLIDHVLRVGYYKNK